MLRDIIVYPNKRFLIVLRVKWNEFKQSETMLYFLAMLCMIWYGILDFSFRFQSCDLTASNQKTIKHETFAVAFVN